MLDHQNNEILQQVISNYGREDSLVGDGVKLALSQQDAYDVLYKAAMTYIDYCAMTNDQFLRHPISFGNIASEAIPYAIAAVYWNRPDYFNHLHQNDQIWIEDTYRNLDIMRQKLLQMQQPGPYTQRRGPAPTGGRGFGSQPQGMSYRAPQDRAPAQPSYHQQQSRGFDRPISEFRQAGPAAQPVRSPQTTRPDTSSWGASSNKQPEQPEHIGAARPLPARNTPAPAPAATTMTTNVKSIEPAPVDIPAVCTSEDAIKVYDKKVRNKIDLTYDPTNKIEVATTTCSGKTSLELLEHDEALLKYEDHELAKVVKRTNEQLKTFKPTLSAMDNAEKIKAEKITTRGTEINVFTNTQYQPLPYATVHKKNDNPISTCPTISFDYTLASLELCEFTDRILNAKTMKMYYRIMEDMRDVAMDSDGNILNEDIMTAYDFLEDRLHIILRDYFAAMAPEYMLVESFFYSYRQMLTISISTLTKEQKAKYGWMVHFLELESKMLENNFHAMKGDDVIAELGSKKVISSIEDKIKGKIVFRTNGIALAGPRSMLSEISKSRNDYSLLTHQGHPMLYNLISTLANDVWGEKEYISIILNTPSGEGYRFVLTGKSGPIAVIHRNKA